MVGGHEPPRGVRSEAAGPAPPDQREEAFAPLVPFVANLVGPYGIDRRWRSSKSYS